MKKQVTRLTALLLAVSMSFSLLSTSAWATELPVEETEAVETVEQGEAIPEAAPDAEETEETEALPEEELPEEAPDADKAEESEALPEEEPVSDEAEESEPLETELEVVPEAEGVTQWAAASGTCGDNVTWTLDDEGKLTISGTGPMTDYDERDMPWHAYADSIQTVVIESGVTSIGDGAFYGYSNLSSVTIPNSVTSIGDWTFNECTRLSNITIPDGVTSIGQNAFSWCTNLSSVAIPSSVTSIGDSAFEGTPWLVNQTKNNMVIINHILLKYNGSDASVVIPESVTSIGDGAFYGRKTLSTVTIPGSVTSIGDRAFFLCTKLSSITIPEDVTSIESGTFYECSSLSSITIPNSVTSIGESAFSGCKNLSSVAIPSNVMSIGKYAFFKCRSLSSITIPDGVTSIDDNTFCGCTNLSSITIPEDVTSIGESVFDGCSSLSSITIPAGVTSIGNGTFSGCSNLSSVTIPSSVTSIGDRAFYECSSLSSIAIPVGVTSIKSSVFSDCTSLSSITIPNSVMSINDNAFYGCSSLSSIAIPEGVTSIGSGAFYGCTSLSNIEIPSSVTRIGDSAFEDTPWLSSQMKNNMVIVNHILVKYDGEDATVTIPAGVTSIGSNAFSSCSSLSSVTIPAGVTSIDDHAFSNCSSLGSVTIPAGVTSIGNYAFADCSSLSSITIPNSVTSIGDYAFFWCTSLSSVEIPSSVTGISSSSFAGTPWLVSQTKNNMAIINHILVKYDGEDATVTIPDGVTSISGSAFADCNSLISITIPNSVTSIGDSAFNDCYNLSRIYFKGNAPTFGENVFCGDDVLTAYYPYSNSTWTDSNMLNYGGTVTWKESALTMLETPPLTSVTNAATGVVFKWEEVPNAAGYYIYRKTGSGGWSKIATINNDSTVSYTDTAVKSQNGIVYTYTVCAYNGDIISDYNETGKTIVRLTTPAAPSLIAGSKQMSVKWVKNASATGYQIEYADNSSFKNYKLTAVVGANSVGKVIKNLTEGKIYYVRMRTYHTYNRVSYFSDWSSVKSVNISLATPTLVAAVNATTGIVFKWSKVPNATGYYVCRKTSKSNWVRIATIKNSSTVVYGDTAVKSQNGIAYTYTVRAYNSNGLSDYNKSGKTVVRMTTPTVLILSNPSSKKMAAKWAKNASATGYQLEYADNSSFKNYKLTAVVGATSVGKVIGSLTKGKTYYVRMRTYKTYNNVSHFSDWSGVESVKISK